MTTALIARCEFKRMHNMLATTIRRGIRKSVGKCENCGNSELLEVHHVIKLCDGGTDFGDNLVILCKDCHDLIHEEGIQ